MTPEEDARLLEQQQKLLAELNAKHNSVLAEKEKLIADLQMNLAKGESEKRVLKIHSLFKGFKYEDKMSVDFLDGYTRALEDTKYISEIKEHGGVPIPPAGESAKKIKQGFVVKNYTDLKEEGGQL